MADENEYDSVLHVIWVCDIDAIIQTEPPIVALSKDESVGNPSPMIVRKVPPPVPPLLRNTRQFWS